MVLADPCMSTVFDTLDSGRPQTGVGWWLVLPKSPLIHWEHDCVVGMVWLPIATGSMWERTCMKRQDLVTVEEWRVGLVLGVHSSCCFYLDPQPKPVA